MSDQSSNQLLPDANHPAAPAAPALPHIEGYEILGLLGEGPLGLVWRAVKSDSARLVALKLISADVFADDAAWVHFERDADVAAQFDHPNIPRIYENAWRDQSFCLATALVEGVPLDQYALQHRLSSRDVLCLLGKIGDAVQYAHERGLIHGRLKPTNILITPDGEPHVLDFGLTKLCPARDAAELTEFGEVDGALACLAPEQVAGEVEYTDTRTDVYSLGAVLFRLLTGQWPPQAMGVPVTIGINADPELTALLAKAIARDPAGRYASAGELARDIRRYLAGEPLRAIEPSAGYWMRKAIALYRVPFIIVVFLLAWIVAYGVLNLLALIGERNQANILNERLEKRLNRTSAILRHTRATAAATATGPATTTTSTTKTGPAVAPPTEHELYTRLLQAAQQRLAEGAVDQAETVLWEAPPASRNADWLALLTRCHRDLWTLRPAGNAVTGLAVSPDNKRLAIAGAESVALWTAEPLREVVELRGAARALAFAPDGRRLATAGDDNTVRVWDAATGRSLTALKLPAQTLAFSADGARLLLASANPAELMIADLATAREPRRISLGGNPLGAVAFTPAGRRLVCASGQTEVKVWDAERGQALWTFRAPAKVTAVGISADGARVAAAGIDGRVFFWEVEQGRELPALRDAGPVPITLLAFAPDGRALLVAGAGRPGKLWEITGGRELQVFTDPLTVAAFAPNARRILAGQANGAVRWWPATPLPELGVTDTGITRDAFLQLKQARQQQWLKSER
jgi:hypothetical protein